MSYSLYHGDCMEIMPRLPPVSVDLIVADLPYGTTNIEWDNRLPLSTLWAEYKRLLKPSGCIVLFGSQPFTSMLVMSNPDWFKYELVWDKNKCGSPGLAKFRPLKTHENILVFAPGKTTYNPQMTEGEPYSRRAPKKTRCNHHGYGFKNTDGIENNGTRYPKSVLNISRDFSAQQQVHPTQKPLSLMTWIIRTFANPGDTVLDNVVGSGADGVAAVIHGCHFIGIDTEKSYLDITERRIKEAIGEDLL